MLARCLRGVCEVFVRCFRGVVKWYKALRGVCEVFARCLQGVMRFLRGFARWYDVLSVSLHQVQLL